MSVFQLNNLFYYLQTCRMKMRNVRGCPKNLNLFMSVQHMYTLRRGKECAVYFVTFLIQWLLTPAASSVSRYWSSFVYFGLAYEIYSGGGPSFWLKKCLCVHFLKVYMFSTIMKVFDIFGWPHMKIWKADWKNSILTKSKLQICVTFYIL